nr:MAG TPA: Receptor Binding Protein [Caudoviricetes sp.]
MAEKYGFFNANKNSDGSYDRTYDASDFSSFFKRLVGNGVFDGTGTGLQVVAKSGRTVTLKAGAAYINGYWYELTEDMTFTLSVNSGASTRTDLIVLQWSLVNRSITATVRSGVSTVSANRSSSLYELVLADIKVGVSATEVTNASIHDDRQDKNLCGIVTGLIDQLDVTEAFKQMNAQFNEWFDTIKGQLSTDAAGNLQTQIDNTNKKITTEVNNLKTKVNGQTAVIIKDITCNGGAYDSRKLPLPSGFTADNCMVIGYAVKKTSGTGFNDDWSTGSNINNAYSTYCTLNRDNTVTVGFTTDTTLRGNMSLRVMVMKMGDIS